MPPPRTSKPNDSKNTTTTRSAASSFPLPLPPLPITAKDRILNACDLSLEEFRRISAMSEQHATPEDVLQHRSNVTIAASKVSTDDIRRITPLAWWEEVACAMFLAVGIPMGVFTIPICTFLLGKFVLGGKVAMAFGGMFAVLTPLAIVPQPFVPSVLTSRISWLLLKYFSVHVIFDEGAERVGLQCVQPYHTKQDRITKSTRELHPEIMVGPPHGVFPYGNILSMFVWPIMTGHHFKGLASSAALRVPIFKQQMRSVGIIDASRSSARKALENYPYTIGISTGGVAEVFETNNQDESVVLKERMGVVKLAIRTGASLAPCYVFGNTKLLSCWAFDGFPFLGGRGGLLERLSRKLGFALILIFGRFGLPVPYRLPVMVRDPSFSLPVCMSHYTSLIVYAVNVSDCDWENRPVRSYSNRRTRPGNL
jgi:1-acyl-sn-glycerol-3-phosphate acyltransferase